MIKYFTELVAVSIASGILVGQPTRPTQPFILTGSDIPVLKIISVLVPIKFELNHFSISFYTVSELFSVLVSIKFF